MTAMEEHKNSLIQVCGGYQQAVNAATDFSRRLWALSLSDSQIVKRKSSSGKTKYYRIFDADRLAEAMAPLGEGAVAAILRGLAESDLYFEREPREQCFKLPAFLPLDVVNAVLPGLKVAHEMRYFIMRSIRQHYGALLCSGTAHLFHLLTKAINDRHAAEPPKPIDETHSLRHLWKYAELMELLERTLGTNPAQHGAGTGLKEPAEFFLECCRAIGYLQPHYRTDSVRVRANKLDAEFLVSNLFGLSTRIRGFDGLFGGGGILLAEGEEEQTCEALNGRTILIIGRFGTGKTLLTLQLAIEVARKGGLAWIMPLEQVAEEYRYILESMNLITGEDAIDIATDTPSARRVLAREDENRGALIILTTLKDSFEDFLSILKDNAERMNRYPLRIICVDPINSIARQEDTNVAQLREQVVSTINEIESSGTNIMLVAEEDRDVQGERKQAYSGLGFEEKVADTVIHLTVKRKYDYAQRYFEITKSRLQREQRGLHAFSIYPGAGVVILPSAAAVRAKMLPRTPRMPKDPVKFGLASLDAILGQGAVLGGDVVVLHGPEGSLKKSLGLIFLMTSDYPAGESGPTPDPFYADFQRKPLSLLISARDGAFTYKHIRGQEYIKNSVDSQQPQKEMWICELHGGYVNPGYVFQRLDDLFEEARAKKYWVDRVMVDGIAHWEMSCPFIRDDETFADTLVDYMRKHGVTTLLVCEEQSAGNRSALQRPIIDSADAVIQFDRYEFRGKQNVLLKVRKSRDMMHRRESFNLSLSAKALDVNPSAALLRVTPGGSARAVKVSLFLHSETNTQKKIYNQHLLSQVRSAVSPQSVIAARDRAYIARESTLGSAATVDELQVYQLDEFQVPYASDIKNANFPLHVFSASEWDETLWGDLVGRLKERVTAPDGSFFAIPYYENLSLLAYRHGELKEDDVSSWESLARACAEWESEPENANQIFFDFPKVTVENYTCLFWEILLSLEGPPTREGKCRMRQWLRGPKVVKAGKIYRQLCRRAHLAEVNNEATTQERRASASDGEKNGPRGMRQLLSHQYYSLEAPINVNTNAVVWRHWYSTLNQLMSLLSIEQKEEIKIVPLPNEITVAGEWYWGIPNHSAAPEIGLEIIKLLTKPAAELDRLQLGVGLPTRKRFYDSIAKSESGEIAVSPDFSMNAAALRRLVNSAFRRSDFGCYASSFSAIAHYLQNIIELPDGSEQDIERGISHNLESFQLSVEFARPEWQCSKCRIN
jgi:KaiC/GvpD/RAD55 family RecA-like ATPase